MCSTNTQCTSLPKRWGRDHPGSVCEAAPLAAVLLQRATYALHCALTDWVVVGRLSRLQLEGALFACQKYLEFLPASSGSRAGFIVGDSAGVAKGRQLAAVIMGNLARGRRRALWLSTSADLSHAAERDPCDVGCHATKVIYNLSELDSMKSSKRTNGALFCTYSSLIFKKAGMASRLEHLIGVRYPEDLPALVQSRLEESQESKSMLVTNAKEEATRVTEMSPRVDQNAVYKMQKRAPTITDFLKALWKIQKNCVLDDNSKMQARTRGIANDQKKFLT